jgi:hypothetical protein
MMYITYASEGESAKRTVGMHVGDRAPTWESEVISVQADGDELEAIYARRLYPYDCPLNHGTHTYQRVVTFYGDAAKFIVGNW